MATPESENIETLDNVLTSVLASLLTLQNVIYSADRVITYDEAITKLKEYIDEFREA